MQIRQTPSVLELYEDRIGVAASHTRTKKLRLPHEMRRELSILTALFSPSSDVEWDGAQCLGVIATKICTSRTLVPYWITAREQGGQSCKGKRERDGAMALWDIWATRKGAKGAIDSMQWFNEAEWYGGEVTP